LLPNLLQRVIAIHAEAEAHANDALPRGDSDASTRFVVSRKFAAIAA
jgi:hypothetical protein